MSGNSKERLHAKYQKKPSKLHIGPIYLLVAIVVVVVGVITMVPNVGYSILGTFIKKQVTITVQEATATALPITNVSVTMAGHHATTDPEGRAIFSNVPVGQWEIRASKDYYDATIQTISVGPFRNVNIFLTLKPTAGPKYNLEGG